MRHPAATPTRPDPAAARAPFRSAVAGALALCAGLVFAAGGGGFGGIGVPAAGAQVARDGGRDGDGDRDARRRIDAAEEAGEDGEGGREKGPKRMDQDELERLAAGTVERRPLGFQTLAALPPPGLDWTELGPKPILDEYWSGSANASGRVTAIAVDPRNGQVAYIAGAQGGVWKTTNGGASWTPLTEALSSLASGALALEPQNPDVVYYATGEQHYSIDSFYGDGVFRSEDGGATWAKIATKPQAGSYVARVAISPDDPTILYLASNRGVVRSLDRGATWTLVLAVSGKWCNDLVVDPVNAGTVYAALYGTGVYRSLDYGATWTLLTGGLPTTGFERINIAIAPTNPLRLFAAFVDENSNGLYGLYRTDDAGANWTRLTTTPNYLGSQGWYDNCLIVDPLNANRVYAGGTFPYGAGSYGIVRSSDGGTSWTDITIGSGNTRVHPDQHIFAFGPDLALWVGNDGGVWRRADGATSWINCNSTLALTQFYSVAQAPDNPATLVGGTQDNGTVRFSGGPIWTQVAAGDGGPVAFRADDPSQFFTTYVYMNPLYKWRTTGASLGTVTGPWASLMDRVDWAQGPLVADPGAINTMLAGTYRVWRTTNGGSAWSAISGDLTGGSGVLRSIAVSATASNTIWTASSDGRVFVTTDAAAWDDRSSNLPSATRLPDLVLDPADDRRAWLIADRSSGTRVFHSADAGTTWTSLTGTLPAGLRPLALAVDFRVAPPRLYVGTDYGVYVTSDEGAHWIKADAGIPDVAVYDLALDPYHNFLVAATHGRGMFRAAPDVEGPALALGAPLGGESWEANTERLVTWSASDPAGIDSISILLSIDGGASFDSTLATGLPNTGSFQWTTPDTTLPACRVRVLAYDAWRNVSATESVSDFAIVRTVAVTGPAGGAGDFALQPAWPNPARNAATLRYVLPRTTRIALEVIDLSGRRVRTLAGGMQAAGVHDARWDGRDDAGRSVGAGVYFVRLSAEGFRATRRIAWLD